MALNESPRISRKLPKIVKTNFSGESLSIAQKGVRAIVRGGRVAARNGESAAKVSVRAAGLSTDQCEHLFV